MRVRAFPPGSSRSSTRLSVLSTIIVPVHATELFHDLADLPGSRDAGATDGIYARRLPRSDRWLLLKELTQNLSTSGWREAMTSLGYQIESLPKRGYLASTADQPVIVIHPRQSADPFARLDEDGRLPEGMLVAD